MQASSSSSADCDLGKDLHDLFDVFGSNFSLEDVKIAYFQSRQDKNLAAEILCSQHGNSSNTTTAGMVAADNAATVKLTAGLNHTGVVSSEFSSVDVLDNTSAGGKKTSELKSRKCSASMGSVSRVIGKEYFKTRPLKNEVIEVKKPLKLDSKDIPASELWNEKVPSGTAKANCPAQADVEEFLFKMLGEGFQLDMLVIQEVLGLSGYDMEKSVDKLLDISIARYGHSEDVCMDAEDSGKLKPQDCVFQELASAESDGAGSIRRSLMDLRGEKDINAVQQEVLQALFEVPDRCEEAPKRTRLVRAVKQRKKFSKLVFETSEDATREDKSSATEIQAVTRDEEENDDNSYDVLRTAVKEYWTTTKEYYKAAVDAFVKGDHARANKLLEQGQFFNRKVREADDKSCQKLVETRDAEAMSLKLGGLEPKEALSLLRLHLTSVSGISSIRYLRVIIQCDNEDSSKGERKRKLILKQLEKESITWQDESNGKSILIQVDEIDPKRLSFGKKQESKGLKPGYYF